LDIPNEAQGVVLFAHGSGSSRHSSRNRYVAQVLQEASLGTLLFDLLTEKEEQIDEQTRHLRFDIILLANRLIGVTDWLLQQFWNSNTYTDILNIGYFGASTGAAAALIAAAKRPDVIRAVVSRGGRPDLAGDEYLNQVRAPTLLVVGGNDEPVIGLNHEAHDKLLLLKEDQKRVKIIPGATHLFDEPGKIEQVAQLASEWFARFLRP
jgi:putative phosphoribosyl transferase